MSNDNDPRDEAMREIEAALDEFADRYREQWTSRSCDPGDARRAGEASDKVLALIRSKLPQPDAEHERAVEAWVDRVKSKFSAAYLLIENGDLADAIYECLKGDEVVDEALRLMRARPAPHTFYGGTERSYAELVAKEQAAGELLRAAKAAVDYRTARTVDQVELVLNCLRIQIAKAERAGIKP